LREAKDIDFAKFKADIRSQRFVGRTLQIAIEAVLDSTHHIISDEGYREPDSYADAFTVLAEHKVISEDNAEYGKLMAQFRNKLVHYYEKIEPEQVYSIFSQHLEDFDRFVAAIRRWMNGL
jgi:uncharacterized protein YutE (UPF0331/DUF86 family)